ncbi:lysylphosphatidylglycerol synthase transmembrane domain-containing protein [Streptomonospora alba]|uniref:lysylphosphatidylglycerol synthase transmembrane domain-containing protein n=1 Tax=Streptomonospora alba TaxID=183763 RepID=UPI000699A5F9|nr:lysylphosphatidylglycerol synthase transmembrane domain-containing protein [Streptomonospora alba]
MLNRLRANRWVRLVVVVVVLACAGIALYSRWEEAREALAALSPWAVGASLPAALAGLGAQMMAWRSILAGLGSRLPVGTAARVMFLGQLGKYLPGSVWAFVAQVELARDHDVARRRGIAATVLAVAVTLTVNLAVAAGTLPFVSADAARRWWWVLAVAPVLLALLHPRVVTALINTAMRPARRFRQAQAAEVERVSGRGMAGALGWSLVAWIPLSLHVWVLVAAAGGGQDARALPVAAGAYALAWTLGLLVVFAPAGLGVRELVLVVGLAPVLDPGSALVVAALSRLVMTAADLLWAGGALIATRAAAAPRPGRPAADGSGSGSDTAGGDPAAG